MKNTAITSAAIIPTSNWSFLLLFKATMHFFLISLKVFLHTQEYYISLLYRNVTMNKLQLDNAPGKYTPLWNSKWKL